MTWEDAILTMVDHPQIARFRELASDPNPAIQADWKRKLPGIALDWLVDGSIQEQLAAPMARPVIKTCGSC